LHLILRFTEGIEEE